jgi:hypothetical protein
VADALVDARGLVLMLNAADVMAMTVPPPPPPPRADDPADELGLVATTLPAELDAYALAASVAAVERSPATAANAA